MAKIRAQLATYLLDGEPLNYELIRSPKRVKTIAIAFDESRGFWLSVPHDTTEAQVADFLKSREHWLRKLRRIPIKGESRKDWDEGVELRFRGRTVLAKIDPSFALGSRDRVTVQLSMDGGHLRIGVPEVMDRNTSSDVIESEIERWYKDEARHYLPARLAHWSELTGLHPERVRISHAKKRWGSCSLTKTVNLAWRLVTLPDELSDYVMVHELAHLQEMNHQKSFWDLVESIMPDAKARRRALRQRAATD